MLINYGLYDRLYIGCYSKPSRMSFDVRHTDALVIYLSTILGTVTCYIHKYTYIHTQNVYVFLFYFLKFFLSRRIYVFLSLLDAL